jgi:hypothetical protein
MKDFNPLRMREAQGLEPNPDWLLSVEKQRKFLAKLGLRESAPNADGWTALERIPSEGLIAKEGTFAGFTDKAVLDGKLQIGTNLRGDRKWGAQ